MNSANRAVNRLHGAASLLLCAACLFPYACTSRNEGQGIKDETHWSKSQPIDAVNRMQLECEFDDSFPLKRAQQIEYRLLQELLDSGFEISNAAPYCLRVYFHPIVQGSRGLPTSSRYCKVSVDIALVELAGKQERVRGHIDGVIDETAYASSEREARQDHSSLRRTIRVEVPSGSFNACRRREFPRSDARNRAVTRSAFG